MNSSATPSPDDERSGLSKADTQFLVMLVLAVLAIVLGVAGLVVGALAL